MPATKKNKVNYRAAAHSDELSTLSTSVHKRVLQGAYISAIDLDSLIRLANDLARELRGIPANTQVPMEDFLNEGSKSDVAKLPTVQVPAMEKPVEKPKSFLGR